MSEKNTKYKASGRILSIDKYAVFRTSAVLFLIAAVFFAILLFGYSKNNKKTAARLLYETAHQKSFGIKNAVLMEYSYLENLSKAAAYDKIQVQNTLDSLFAEDDYKGISESIYIKNYDETQQKSSGIAVLEDGRIELSVKFSENDFLCAALSGEKLSAIVDNGSFAGKSSVILYEVNSGNIVVNTARMHGFYGNKIGFLLNHKFDSGFSAKKLFSDIDDKKSGYTQIKSENQKYSVCYAPVDMGDLYILMFVPKTAVFPVISGGITTVFAAVLLVVSVFFAVLFVIMGTKKASDDRKKRKFWLEVVNKALRRLSEDDRAGIYVYRKATDELDIIKDINSGQREITVSEGISYLAGKMGLGEADKRKLKNAINLSGPEKDMRINVVSSFDKETVSTEISFSYIKHYQKGRNALVCVAKRCDAQEANDAAGTKEMLTNDGINTTCVELFLERNIWHFLWNNEPVFEKAEFVTGMQNNYDVQLKKEIIPYIKEADRQKVITALDRLNLLCAFRNGEFERTVVFSMADDGEHFSKRCLDVRIYRDNYNDEIKANLYIRSILIE